MNLLWLPRARVAAHFFLLSFVCVCFLSALFSSLSVAPNLAAPGSCGVGSRTLRNPPRPARLPPTPRTRNAPLLRASVAVVCSSAGA